MYYAFISFKLDKNKYVLKNEKKSFAYGREFTPSKIRQAALKIFRHLPNWLRII